MTTIFNNFAKCFGIAAIMFVAKQWTSAQLNSAQSASNQSVPLIGSTPINAGSAQMFAPLTDYSEDIKTALVEILTQWVVLVVSLCMISSISYSKSPGQASGDIESPGQASGEVATESQVAANNSDESQVAANDSDEKCLIEVLKTNKKIFEMYNLVILSWKLSVQEKNEQLEALQKEALTQQTQLQAQKQQLEALQKCGQEKDSTIEELRAQKIEYEPDVAMLTKKLTESENNFLTLFHKWSQLRAEKNMACTCGLGFRGQ